ncbi:MAG: HAD-IA family hydrolase, partial [Lachnospiraceae bacterium]|nr:HAD-IA family hydrolase [Lachnospiraceae bacterium]
AAPHAKEILQKLTEQGIPCFVFTHRGKTTIPILKRLQLYEHFTEIITREERFARKPAPDANLYLMDKYQLNPACTYFVGDRQLDMECAEQAGIKKILYVPEQNAAEPSGREEYVIRDFLQILQVVSGGEENEEWQNFV